MQLINRPTAVVRLFRFAPLLALAALTLVGCGGSAPTDEISSQSSGVSIRDISPQYSATDWPTWRGPNQDGHAAAAPIPTTWDDSTNVAWTADIPGRGHSSPIVAGNLVILATADDQSEQQEVHAFDLETGSPIWSKVLHQGGFPLQSQMHGKSTNANSTLAFDGEHLFATFLNHDQIYCTALDLTGEIVWQKVVGNFASKFGYAPSPMLYKSFVIVSADHRGGGYLAALDRETGEIAWRKNRSAQSSYSTARVLEVAGKDQLIISGCNEVASYDPATGDKFWSTRATTEATCGTIVANDTHVFASGGFPGSQTVAIAADGSGTIAWQSRTKLYEPSLILVDGHLYGVNDQGVATCWNAETGEECWQSRIPGGYSASPIAINDLIYVSNDSGLTTVFEPNPASLNVIAENQLQGGIYASPAVSGDRLLLRAGERNGKLVCLQNQASDPTP